MALDVIAKLESIKNLLRKNNTNTSTLDISDGLDDDRRVCGFYKGVNGLHEHLPVPKNQYPAVFVEADTQVEDFAQIGNACKQRDVELVVSIVSVTMYEAPAYAEEADIEAIRLAQNIHALIRANITLSQTVDHSNITSVEYSTVLREDTYNNVIRTQLNTRFLTT